MEKKKEIRVSLSEKNWKKAKKKAEGAGVSLSGWIAVLVEDKLIEQDAMLRLCPGTQKKFAEDFQGIYAGLTGRVNPADKTAARVSKAAAGMKKAGKTALHSEKLERVSRNLIDHMRSLEPAIEKIKNASKSQIQSEKWDKTSKRLHEELKSLEPAIEKLKKSSRECLHSPAVEKASRQFSEQMKSVEFALKNLKLKNAGEKENKDGR
jgi:hypothetical protein